MAVTVSRDLSVQVLEDLNTVKLTERQQNVRDAKQRGQPKCIGPPIVFSSEEQTMELVGWSLDAIDNIFSTEGAGSGEPTCPSETSDEDVEDFFIIGLLITGMLLFGVSSFLFYRKILPTGAALLEVSQIMLGLMIMSYSIPLHFINVTEVVYLGVPWWSGLVFITAGVVAIILDKHCTTRTYQASLMVNVVSTVVSVIAVIVYSVDLDKHPEASCVKKSDGSCNANFYATRLTRGLKFSLLLFTMAQTAGSATLCFYLYRMKYTFGLYSSFTEAASTIPRRPT